MNVKLLCTSPVSTLVLHTIPPKNYYRWSGEVHGNERVGPTAVLEAAQVLLDAATCESLPRYSTQHDSSNWGAELVAAQDCRQNWKDRGYLDSDRKWLARLVSTRRIVIVPTANALGYFRNAREEGNLDANRDFPYDLLDPTQCMQTIAGRTLNEVFREHMFQLSLTFHGGEYLHRVALRYTGLQ
jgi:hypothetical protein